MSCALGCWPEKPAATSCIAAYQLRACPLKRSTTSFTSVRPPWASLVHQSMVSCQDCADWRASFSNSCAGSIDAFPSEFRDAQRLADHQRAAQRVNQDQRVQLPRTEVDHAEPDVGA